MQRRGMEKLANEIHHIKGNRKADAKTQAKQKPVNRIGGRHQSLHHSLALAPMMIGAMLVAV
jgi:hypothetical protein